MSMIQKFGLANSPLMPALNTGTLIDLAVGKFERGIDGKWYLNGGLSPMSAIVGRPGNYKSTTIDSIIVLLLRIYPSVEVLKYDTEMNAFGVDRYVTLANGDISVSTRVVIWNKADKSGEEFEAFIKEFVEDRKASKAKKGMLHHTPFLLDGKPLDILIPFIIDVDSFTQMTFDASDKSLTENSAGSNKTNMFYLNEGNIKTKLISAWTKDAHHANIYFVFTAQMDDEPQLDPFKPIQKQLQFMKLGDKIKRVGTQFEFLTNDMFQNMNSKALLDSNKECLYPLSSGSSAGELSLLTMRVLRCKKNVAGTEIPLVTSQNFGILSNLTNYHYLKQEKWGLTGSDRSPRSVFHPEEGLGRKEVRDKLKDNYELCRGLEILAQIRFIKTTWTNVPFAIPDAAEELVARIGKSKLKIKDVLNSRGYWTYDSKDPRAYLSAMDILEAINN